MLNILGSLINGSETENPWITPRLLRVSDAMAVLPHLTGTAPIQLDLLAQFDVAIDALDHADFLAGGDDADPKILAMLLPYKAEREKDLEARQALKDAIKAPDFLSRPLAERVRLITRRVVDRRREDFEEEARELYAARDTASL